MDDGTNDLARERELTINGVYWTVEFVPPAAGDTGSAVTSRAGARKAGGLQYTSENGFRCFVPIGETPLAPTPSAFASASDDVLADLALRALRRRHARQRPPSAA
jgi:hypothetical protein